jgi:AcrR family transcriptional regulator
MRTPRPTPRPASRPRPGPVGPRRRPVSPAASGAREEAAPDADTGQRLLEAAAGLFAERGYRGATMRAIAARAGVNGAAANYHFGNKQQLYLEVARQRFERLERRLVEGGADPGAEELAGRSPEEFAALLRARIRVFLGTMLEEDPVHGALMLHELATPSEARRCRPRPSSAARTA